MTFRPSTLGAAAALALVVYGGGADASPARKPAAAARAKPAKPVPKIRDATTEPDVAASDALVGAPPAADSGDAAPPAADVSPVGAEGPRSRGEPSAALIGDMPTVGEISADHGPAPEPTSTEAAPGDAPAAPRKGEPPTHAYMVGVWAEEGKKCETALDFKADGTLIGPFPRWELSDTGELTMVGNRQKIMLKVVDKNTMESRRSEKDPPRTLKRCP